MEQDFYKGRLTEKHGLSVVIPNNEDRDTVHKIIYNELCHGNIKDSSRKEYIRIIENMVKHGAEGVILGCTEIPLLIKHGDVNVPVFDTTTIHAEQAVLQAIK
jgi:aspartate racemase